MQEIIIDEEFKKLLPELDKETYAWLEESLLEYGCQNPLVLWNGILIDGHNRYEIIKRHDLPFRTISMEFDSREHVIIWIISTQVARRNLTPLQLSHFRGLHYNTDKLIVKNDGGKNQHSELWDQNDPKARNKTTAQRLAEQYNVSQMTIKRDANVSNAIMAIGEVSSEAKRKILAGGGNISRTRLQELATAAETDIIETIDRILEGTHERRKVRSSGNAKKSESAHNDDSENYEQLSLENFIIKITDDFNSGIRNLSLGEDTSKSKTVLRSFIKMLEELYDRI